MTNSSMQSRTMILGNSFAIPDITPGYEFFFATIQKGFFKHVHDATRASKELEYFHRNKEAGISLLMIQEKRVSHHPGTIAQAETKQKKIIDLMRTVFNTHFPLYLNLAGSDPDAIFLQELANNTGVTRLQSLNLWSTGFDAVDCAIAQSLQALFIQCQSLTYINLNGRCELSDLSVLTLSAHCTLLITLKLRQCRDVTDESLVPSFQRLRKLRSVDISGCCKITHKSIESLADHCKNLEHVNAQACYLLTTQITQTLSSCQQLQSVNVAFCFNRSIGLSLTHFLMLGKIESIRIGDLKPTGEAHDLHSAHEPLSQLLSQSAHLKKIEFLGADDTHAHDGQ